MGSEKTIVPPVRAFALVNGYSILMRSCARNEAAAIAFGKSTYGAGVFKDESDTVIPVIIADARHFDVVLKVRPKRGARR